MSRRSSTPSTSKRSSHSSQSQGLEHLPDSLDRARSRRSTEQRSESTTADRPDHPSTTSSATRAAHQQWLTRSGRRGNTRVSWWARRWSTDERRVPPCRSRRLAAWRQASFWRVVRCRSRATGRSRESGSADGYLSPNQGASGPPETSPQIRVATASRTCRRARLWRAGMGRRRAASRAKARVTARAALSVAAVSGGTALGGRLVAGPPHVRGRENRTSRSVWRGAPGTNESFSFKRRVTARLCPACARCRSVGSGSGRDLRREPACRHGNR